MLIDREIQPLQTELLRRSYQLRAFNDEQLHEIDQALLAQFGELQGSLTRSIILALGSGLLLILASMIYILRLEQQTRLRYDETVRSRGELERLSARLVDAQETERRNISRELHDEVGQTLGALLVDFGRLTAALGECTPEVKEMVGKMQEIEMIAELEPCCSGAKHGAAAAPLNAGRSRPGGGARVAGSREVVAAAASDGSGCPIGKTSPRIFPDDYKVTIYRLVQEALTNAVRHAGARNASVRVEQTGDQIKVMVTDDGRGFDPKRSRGMGMLGMEERVRRLGGRIAFQSAPGQGTTITAEMPVEVPVGAQA